MATLNPNNSISFLWKNLFKVFFVVTVLSFHADASDVRIVSLNPALTEILFDLGLEEKIVGTSSFSNYPVQAKKIPTVGSYIKPSIEKILRLRPTHVLVFKEGDPTIEESLKRAKVNYILYDSRTLTDFKNTVASVAKLFDVEKKAAALLNDWNKQWSLVESMPKLNKRTMIQVDHNPIFIAGKDTFISEAFLKCGLTNVFSNVTGYKKVQMEAILNRKPSAIIITGHPKQFNDFESIREYWVKNPITKNALIVKAKSDSVSRLSTRLPSAIMEVCAQMRNQ